MESARLCHEVEPEEVPFFYCAKASAAKPGGDRLTIGEASRALGIEPHTLRYYEKEFKDFIRPRRDGRRNRLYSRRDMANLAKIKELLEVELYTIAGARRQMYLTHTTGDV